jgi:hypothetical protein
MWRQSLSLQPVFPISNNMEDYMGFLFALLFDGQGNQSRADVEKGENNNVSDERSKHVHRGIGIHGSAAVIGNERGMYLIKARSNRYLAMDRCLRIGGPGRWGGFNACWVESRAHIKKVDMVQGRVMVE